MCTKVNSYIMGHPVSDEAFAAHIQIVKKIRSETQSDNKYAEIVSRLRKKGRLTIIVDGDHSLVIFRDKEKEVKLTGKCPYLALDMLAML